MLHGEATLGDTVAVIGGGIVGTEVGLVLAEQGKEVIFVEMLDTFMNNITFDEKPGLRGALRSRWTSPSTPASASSP